MLNMMFLFRLVQKKAFLDLTQGGADTVEGAPGLVYFLQRVSPKFMK